MKAEIIKHTLADAAACDEGMEFIWENFNRSQNELNGREVFFDYNKEEFEKDIADFFPVLTPFEDYDLSVKKIHDRKEYLEIETYRIYPDEEFREKNVKKHYNNGKQVEFIETEYVRLVMLFIFPEPDYILNKSYRVLKLVSLPVKFKPRKKHYFQVPLPPDFYEYVNNAKEYYFFTYAYNFGYDLETNDNDLELMHGNIISFSNTYSFDGYEKT